MLRFACQVFIFSCALGGVRVFSIPIYDIALFLSLPLVFFLRLKTLPLTIILFSFFLAHYALLAFSQAEPMEAVRYVMTWISLILGYLAGYRNLRLGGRTAIAALVLGFTASHFVTTGDYGSVTLSLYDQGRFSGLFNDPTKLASYMYLGAALNFWSPWLSLVIAVAAQTRAGFAASLLLLIGLQLHGRKQLIVVSASLMLAIILLVFGQQLVYQLSVWVRPEFATREHFDAVRQLSASLLAEHIVNPHGAPLFGILGMRDFLDGSTPPHNTFLSTLYETGWLGFSILLVSISLLWKRYFRSRPLIVALLTLVFLIYDSQSYRLVFFVIGYVAGQDVWQRMSARLRGDRYPICS